MRRREFVCVDLGGTNLKIGLVDEDGKVIRRKRISMKTHVTRQSLYEALGSTIESFIKSLPKGHRPSVVSIGFAGPTDSERGVIYFAPNISCLSDLRIRNHLEARLSLPVIVENDANCAGLGEYWKGAARGSKSSFLFTLGTGIGGCFIINGEVWRGRHGAASEIGHTIVKIDGPKCNCGKRGCLEALVSGTAIVRSYLKRKGRRGTRPQDVTPKAVVEKARQGEKDAKAVIENAARFLGVGIANVFNMLDPEVIILGGGVSRAGRILIEPAVRVAREMVVPQLAHKLRVKRAILGDNAALLGAAYLAINYSEPEKRGRI